MTQERRKEIDEMTNKLALEFAENAVNGDGRFCMLYMSCDKVTQNFNISLQSNSDMFKTMILSMMKLNSEVADDIIDVVQNYYLKDINYDCKIVEGF